MFERYTFIIPVFIVWFFIYFIPIIITFFTPYGLKGKPFFNRSFLMKFVSVSLFLFALMIIFSGILQLLGVSKIILEKPSGYWHALTGFIFLLAALNHILIHIKDIFRYIFKPKPKQKTESDSDSAQ